MQEPHGMERNVCLGGCTFYMNVFTHTVMLKWKTCRYSILTVKTVCHKCKFGIKILSTSQTVCYFAYRLHLKVVMQHIEYVREVIKTVSRRRG